MLEHGEVPRYVPNWWNPYAPNIDQPDPQKKQKLINTIKLVFVVITFLGGAILALCINVFGRGGPDILSESTTTNALGKSFRRPPRRMRNKGP